MAATVNPYMISPLTDGQEELMAVAGVVSGTLSFVGSSIIIFKVTKSFHDRSAPYDRLLLGLSCCDLVASITYAMSPFLLNKATSQRVWPSGNLTSSHVLGFLTQFSFSAIF
jgi:hypothetical protein